MKRYAYIHIITLFFLACLCGCRSNSTLSETRKEAILEQHNEHIRSAEQSNNKSTTNVDKVAVENTTSNQQSISDSTKDSESDEYNSQKTKATYYDKEGNIRAVIETELQSGRAHKSKEQAGSSRSSSESRKDSTNTKTNIESETDINKTVFADKESNIETDVNEETNKTGTTDSRLFQGSEWIFVFIGSAIALVIIVSVSIQYFRNRKK